MCGVTGVIGNISAKEVHDMVSTLSHRGPDGLGLWDYKKVKLAHSRLAIRDLSPNGSQPMESSTKRYVIVFNGEIYNHSSIRKKLRDKGFNNWNGSSDTETLINAIEFWGLEEALKKIIGMFALAIWDRKKLTLSLAIDRFGEKPLYYGHYNGNFLFSSELKALEKISGFKPKINKAVIPLFLKFSSVPHPYCIFEGINKMEPGKIIELNENGAIISSKKYWDSNKSISTARSNQFSGSYDDAVAALDTVLSNAIRKQMESDVPLGAFLSGGIDSSTIVALMQRESNVPIKTFTVGFNESNFSEASHAQKVANYIGTNHHELLVTETDALDVIPSLPYIYDEPFADSSQIPTYLISKLAKQHVTVALSGDSGDEIFGGYNRYVMSNKLWPKIKILPKSVRKIVSKLILSVPVNYWNIFLSPLMMNKYHDPGMKLHKGANALLSENEMDLYKSFISVTHNTSQWLSEPFNQDSYLPTYLDKQIEDLDELNSIEQMMAYDLSTYLPWDILSKVDRAAMANSLETRIPFLDHEVVSFAWSLPIQYKIRKGQGKVILRDLLSKHVPKSLIDRPKMGFGIPLAEWLRGPLGEWTDSLLDKDRLIEENIFNASYVHNRLELHRSGKRNLEHELWNILMFQSWHESQTWR